jgi:hypothetical protein
MSDPITLEQYSEKAIAVFGNTNDHKDSLMTLGGKYNSNLRGRPGWIFTNSARPRVEEFIKNGTVTARKLSIAPTPTVVTSNETDSLLRQIEALTRRIEALEANAGMKRVASAPKPSVDEPGLDEEHERPKRLLRN